MKFKLLGILFFFVTFQAFAQKTSKLDSLKTVLSKLPPEGKTFASDTMRVRVLCEMGFYCFVELGDVTKELLIKSVAISNNINWKKGLLKSYLGLGLYNVGKNQQMQAIDNFYESLSFCEDSDFINKAMLFRYMGDSYSMAGDYEKAINFHLKSIKIYENIKDMFNIIHGYNNLGLVYYDKKDFKKANRIFEFGLKENIKIKDPNLNDYLITNSAFSLLKGGELDLAFKKLNAYIKNKNDKFGYSDITVFVFLADFYLQKNKIIKAKQQLALAQKIIDKYDGVEDAMVEFSEIAYKVYKKSNEPNKALYYLEKYEYLKDLKTSQSTKQRIDALQFEFDNKEKEKQINSLNQTKQIGAGVLLIIGIIGLALFLLNSKLRKTNEIISNQKVEIEKANAKLEDFNIELETKVNQRTAELSTANKELVLKNFEITEALFKGQTIERKRVAAELHDNLGSTLSALKWRLGHWIQTTLIRRKRLYTKAYAA
jgi:tetratricopeptide (TPR) repeat protein